MQKGAAHHLLLVIFTVSCLLIPPGGALAGPDRQNPVIIVDADKQFNFAEHHFATGDFSSAVGEYQRFIHFFAADDRVETAMFRIAMSYFKSGRFQKAIDAFTAVIDRYHDTDPAITSYFMLSECHLKLGIHGPALLTLQNLITIAPDPDVKDEALYRAGWIYLELASSEKARAYFDKISPSNQEKYRLKRLSAALDKENLIPGKKPGLAGLLAILPGAGYVYCERYQDALIAFLVNGVLIYAAYESFDNDLYALGGLVSFVEAGFYAGNIYGSVGSAHKYNRKKSREFMDTLKKNLKVSLAADRRTTGLTFAFQYAF